MDKVSKCVSKLQLQTQQNTCESIRDANQLINMFGIVSSTHVICVHGSSPHISSVPELLERHFIDNAKDWILAKGVY
jgi:hypothetical protein